VNGANANRLRAGLSTDFLLFWAGQTVSNLGSSFTAFALPLLIFRLTGSAVNLALATAVYFLPYLLFGLLIGAWVDRANRKHLMIAADVGRAIVVATIPLLSALNLLNVWAIYAAQFANATFSIVFDSAEFAAIPSLVRQEQLVTANGRIQASYSAASILGPALAGLMVALLPIQWVLLVDSISFGYSGLTLALIRTRFNPATPPAQTKLRQDILDGLRYVMRHPVLRNISVMMALVNFVYSTTYAQLILFAKHRLQASDAQAGLLYSAGSAGVIVLSLAAGPLRRRWPFSVVALRALMAQGLLTILLAFTPWYWAALPLWGVIWGLGALFDINTGSLRQMIVPNHMLGRVISIASVLGWSFIPLGTLAGGVLIERTGNVALIYGAIGFAVFLIPVFFTLTPLGQAERFLPASAPDSAQPAP
jgi:MFS family permease